MPGKLQLDHPAEAVARLTIANPERRGALDHEVLDALATHARSLDARCLIIRGSGSVFSAGYDIGNLEEPIAARPAEPAACEEPIAARPAEPAACARQEFEESAQRLVAHPFHDAIEALEAYRYPVVAEINGHAIGGGLELALTCDIRLAASGAKFGMPPAKLGLIYSHTGLAKFVEVCGAANTAELFFVGENVEAERALRMGLVSAVLDAGDLAERVLALAATIAANAPLSLEGNKRVLRALRARPLSAQVERELIELRESCFGSEDFREGVRAFAEKRKPVWQGK